VTLSIPAYVSLRTVQGYVPPWICMWHLLDSGCNIFYLEYLRRKSINQSGFNN